RQHRPQERGRRARAPAVADAELVRADAVSRLAVEVRVVRQAELLPRANPGLAVRVVAAQPRDAELAAVAVVLARAAFEAFEAAEVRQHVAVAPAARAQPLPVVEVLV